MRTPVFGLLAAIAACPALAADYDPIPHAWGIKVDAPGVITVGGSYCTEDGQCVRVGEEIKGFHIGSTPIGGVQGCAEHPSSGVCLNASVPVHVIALAPTGIAIVELHGHRYSVGGLDWYKRMPDGWLLGGPLMITRGGKWIPVRQWMGDPAP